jgi:hypothetical protein
MAGARRSQATRSSTDPKRAAAPKKKKGVRKGTTAPKVTRKGTTVCAFDCCAAGFTVCPDTATSWLDFRDILLGRVLAGPGGVKGTVGPTYLVGTDFEAVETYQVCVSAALLRGACRC